MIPNRALFGPGPSNVSQAVLDATAQPCIGHLDPVFGAMMEDVKDMLRQVFGTTNPVTFPMSAPASLAMESALVNLLEPGDTAIIGINGVFGGRMADIVDRAGAKAVKVEFEWGTPCDADAMAEAIRANPEAKVVGFVHAETSTGTRTDPAPICRAAREAGMLTIVDTVTGLVGSEVTVDDWGADVVYSGTQKCLSVPPGLAPITFSPRAIAAIEARKTRVQSWFCDLNLVLGYWSGDGARSYHHTAPVNAIYGLHAGLKDVLDEGLAPARARHEAAHQQLAQAMDNLGLKFLVAPENRLPQLNVFTLPEGMDEAGLRAKLLNQHDVEIGAGLGPLAGKVWRIGLMGENARPERVELLTNAIRTVIG
ncbi:pyridoxal-phosphate-dependent aminotransferase family protein [Palleronia caenipelagi]|uniref:Alanine--glyoxylate aminotransferase family protein n=1 Tax=Palleronia caenipelagi TaxID=2489174 RepID=A0A547QB77_9RHOB|nr:alanine--glyoxylate aminotransferase family protein [Palleronia caenipelagi]TRD23625.1 alanine--glyoxylate aminotransferase family protein [Palleronia caenipelagi]